MTAEVIYAIGAVKGPIKLATLEFANHTVPDQAFREPRSSNYNFYTILTRSHA